MSASTIKEAEPKNETNFQSVKSSNKKNDRHLYEKDSGIKKPTALDGIQKELIHREQKAQLAWDKRYGHFLGGTFQQIVAEEVTKAGLAEDTLKCKKREMLPMQSSIAVRPSPQGFPKTSCALIGWRSAHAECCLELTGSMYISPKSTIDVPLEPGMVSLLHQRFIYLG